MPPTWRPSVIAASSSIRRCHPMNWRSTTRSAPTSRPSTCKDVLAQIARHLVEVMRRDVKTDWTVRDDIRDDVRAKLRSSIKRLLVKYKYPPDKQQEAITLVFEQMEEMAPRYAA